MNRATVFGCAAAIAAAAMVVQAQTRYNSGQTIAAAFEGWERNEDGSFNMVFGYMNRNYEEILDIPIGAGNQIEPGDPDRGQPTVFFPRRQQFMFKVRVPADWGQKDLVWTLTHRGHTEKAYGTLKPFWEIDNSIYFQNRAGPGTWNAPNKGPSMKIEPTSRSAVVGEPVPLVAEVIDDGLPAPPAPGQRQQRGGGGVALPPAPGRNGQAMPSTGPIRQNPIAQMVVRLDPDIRLGVIWVLHRRSNTAGNVSFDRQKVEVANGLAATTARFTSPGTYVVRGYADDGILLDYRDVTVTVR